MPLDTSKYKDQKSVELPNLNCPQRSPSQTSQSKNSDRHAQTTADACTSTAQDKVSLANRTQQSLAAIQASVDKIANDRSAVIEQVSDTLAYLYSPQTFKAEVMSATSSKLGLTEAAEPKADLNVDNGLVLIRLASVEASHLC